MGFQKRQVAVIVTNVVCFAVVFATAVLLVADPVYALQRGFFCDDPTIRYPYNKDTISVSLLVITCLPPPLLLVTGLELAYSLCSSSPASPSYSAENPQPKKARMVAGLGRAGILVVCILHGNALCFVITEVFKLTFGGLRPYFLSACRPEADVTSFPNCSGWYIEDIVCLNTDEHILVELRKSFLSGHASFAAFNALFICLYVQYRLPKATPRLLVSVIQGLVLGYAIFVSGTRIYDNAHSLMDVLGGLVLAVPFAWATVYKMCPSFILHPYSTDPSDNLLSTQETSTSLVSMTSVN